MMFIQEFDLKIKSEQINIALLIDAENTNGEIIENLLAEVSKYGNITVRRIYGDWTETRNNIWKEQLNVYAIRPMQKFSYTTGKNSSDTALIIDAMDLLYSKKVNAFCIVSSDSDYTGLAHRIREEGMNVIGVGKEHTPIAFKKACSLFIKVESLENKCNAIPIVTENVSAIKNIDYNFINKAFDIAKDRDNNALLSRFSEALRKVEPTFNIRTYGFNQFRKFCENLIGYKVYQAEDNSTFLLKKLK